MTSSDHDASGAVADWLHRTVAGLAPPGAGPPAAAGGPATGPGITSAAETHQTPYGAAVVSWTVDGTAFTLDVTVPPNTTAEIVLLDGSAPVRVGWGRRSCTGKTTVPTPVEKPAPFFDPEDHQ
jgi:alpha-L-rhamnosidase